MSWALGTVGMPGRINVDKTMAQLPVFVKRFSQRSTFYSPPGWVPTAGSGCWLRVRLRRKPGMGRKCSNAHVHVETCPVSGALFFTLFMFTHLVAQSLDLSILLNLQIVVLLLQRLDDSLKILIFSARLQDFLLGSCKSLVVTLCLTLQLWVTQMSCRVTTRCHVSWPTKFLFSQIKIHRIS